MARQVIIDHGEEPVPRNSFKPFHNSSKNKSKLSIVFLIVPGIDKNDFGQCGSSLPRSTALKSASLPASGRSGLSTMLCVDPSGRTDDRSPSPLVDHIWQVRSTSFIHFSLLFFCFLAVDSTKFSHHLFFVRHQLLIDF